MAQVGHLASGPAPRWTGQVFAQLLGAGGGPSGAERLVIDAQSAVNADVAALANGDFVVTWEDLSLEAGTQIQSLVVDAGGGTQAAPL